MASNFPPISAKFFALGLAASAKLLRLDLVSPPESPLIICLNSLRVFVEPPVVAALFGAAKTTPLSAFA